MTAGWFKRERPATGSSGADDVDARIERQARRAGRTVAEEQESILREVLPNIRRSVAHAGLTMAQYLELNRVEYEDLLESTPGSRSLLGRRNELIDYASFVRLRRWIQEAAERAGEDAETWLIRAGSNGPAKPWERRRAADDAPEAAPRSDVAEAPSTDEQVTGDVLLNRLERLAALRDSGALTDEEFQAQKRRLL